jgi:hypothetical protein
MVNNHTKRRQKSLISKVRIDYITLFALCQVFKRPQVSSRLGVTNKNKVSSRETNLGLILDHIRLTSVTTTEATSPRFVVSQISAKTADVTEAAHVMQVQVIRPRICSKGVPYKMRGSIDIHPCGYLADVCFPACRVPVELSW